MLKSRITPRMLRLQVRWLIRLRWVAGVAVLSGALIDLLWLRWFAHTAGMLTVGFLILGFNILLDRLIHLRGRQIPPAHLAWGQVVVDMILLSLLVAWTGGSRSPLLGFFVFHMVFSSLLLSQLISILMAGTAIALLLLLMAATDQWADIQADWVVLSGWALTLILTVLLTNHITHMLERHGKRLAQRNRRVRRLVDRLRQQQERMIQHEKTAAMGQMVAGVSHEIANPLASIDSLVQLMQRNEKHLTPEKVNTIGEQVNRIKATIRQLTEFAHPTDYAWRPMPLNELAESGLHVVRLDRRRKHVDIQCDFKATDCRIRIQPHATQQALVNLLLNAVDAVAELDDPQVVLSTGCNARECFISVRDNGHGIAAEHLSRLFEPFFTTKPIGKGTGLGLAVSRSLIENQSGRITVESVVGRGTTVAIILPKAVTETESPER